MLVSIVSIFVVGGGGLEKMFPVRSGADIRGKVCICAGGALLEESVVVVGGLRKALMRSVMLVISFKQIVKTCVQAGPEGRSMSV